MWHVNLIVAAEAQNDAMGKSVVFFHSHMLEKKVMFWLDQNNYLWKLYPEYHFFFFLSYF